MYEKMLLLLENLYNFFFFSQRCVELGVWPQSLGFAALH